jgi:predicted Zn-dependent peptidase
MSSKLKKKILDNGLKVLMIPNKKFESVAVGIFVKVGSRYETKKNNGISHFLEHMLFKDKKLVERLDCLGAKYNAETSYETTHYYIYGSKYDYVDFIDIISDIYNSKTFKKEDIEKEKSVITEEYNMLVDDSDEIINDEINKKVFDNSSLKLPIIGNKKNIKSFTKKDLEDYWKKYYVPPNTMFVISGNFNENTAMKKIEEKFGKIKYVDKKDYLLEEPKSIIQKEPKIHLLQENISQTNIMITYRSSSMFEISDTYYDIIADVLSSGCSSRLFKLLRDKLGISYYNYSYNLSYLYEGVFIINVGVDPSRAKECIDEILKEIKNLRKNGITEAELDKSKKIRNTNYMFSIENPLDVMNHYGFLELFELKDDFKEIDKIKVKDINEIINKIFDKNNLNIFIHGEIN